ncbi:winged helix-turn-helix domain-containing protein [Shewanella corallii]|uniref:Winged helix-turn-helix domain-containing protein n=1 Tax=Shewanella corallii TaxID=560080 RepID=A0ABT0NB52_9GAMM|nr:winged helix-turn-helix domain-containing protein [Shewanella corallii]MCL2915683.1 winged helix-turn-helix domain-containing protein [Shewanella corallii]
MYLRLGTIALNTHKRQILKAGDELACEPRVFDLLVYFCSHPQRAISREELINKVWNGRVVSEAAVNRAVGELRKLIEANPSSPVLLKTISKVGYELTVRPVFEETESNGELQQSSESASSSGIVGGPGVKLFGVMILLSGLLVWAVIAIYGGKVPKMLVDSREPVTQLKGEAFNPAISPNGDVAFLYKREVSDNAQIRVVDAQGVVSAPINDDYYYTDVIYGSDEVIYASRLDDLHARNCFVVSFSAPEWRETPLFSCGSKVVTELGLAGDGTQLIFKYRDKVSEPYAVYSYHLSTGRRQQLTLAQQWGNTPGHYAFAVAPGKDRLAVIEYFDEGPDLLKIVDIGRAEIIFQAPFIDGVRGLIWFSDDLLLSSNSSGLYQFNLITEQIGVIEKSGAFGRLAVTNVSERLLTEKAESIVNLQSLSISANQWTQVTDNTGINTQPIFANRDETLAYLTQTGDLKSIMIAGPVDKHIRLPSPVDIEYLGALAWSDNDEFLAASINGRLFQFEVATGEWNLLPIDLRPVHHLVYKDGGLIFSAEHQGTWNLWRYDAVSDSVTQLTQAGAYSVQSSSKGLLYTKFNLDGLFLLDPDSGVEEVVIPEFPITSWRKWQIRGDSIYYLDENKLSHLDLNTLETKTLHTFTGKAPNRCTVSSSGYRIVCDRADASVSNIWRLSLD